MTSRYSTRITAYLQILGDFDQQRVKQVELRLIQKLKDTEHSVSRYRRYKTDRTGEHPLLHSEAQAIYDFFQQEFQQAIEQEQDSSQRATLQTWMPVTAMGIYWGSESLAATG